MWKLILTVTLALCSVANATEPTNFLGLTIGGEFNLPECTWFGSGVLASYNDSYEQPVQPCWEHDTLKAHPGDLLDAKGAFEVHYIPSRQHTPSGINPDSITVIVINGRIEGITLLTAGYNAQDELLLSLREKYGAPTKITSNPVHNAMGATFTNDRAKWVRADVTIEFEGIVSEITSGLIKVLSPSAEHYVLDKQQKQKANEGSF
ncbi:MULTISPECIES: hypothetical protein [Rhodanobacter]|uniref:hypothetical protein n=1 Tax=Rhodanobacter TaxID=75309 RepID=UPI000AC25BBB|nr:MULTISPECIES: hypothetical protein [Rhodanobacter]TAN18791.1 MAG: hypothetical protein EPN35_03180 [Rhodanobacter sp.]UJJ55014.1 hypothetical protein LRK53_00990 [Rhodanobacter thiooxydans]